MQIYLGNNLPENAFRDDLKSNESIVNTYKAVERIYRKAYRKVMPSIRSTIVWLLVPIWFPLLVVTLPFLYLYLMRVVRRSSIILKKLQILIPSLTINELESIKRIFNELDNRGINEDFAQKLLEAPALFKPLAYTMKENLDQHFVIKKQIDNQIQEDLSLFSLGLEAELPLGISLG